MVRDEQETIREYVKDIEEVAATLEPGEEDMRGSTREAREVDRSIRAYRGPDSPADGQGDYQLSRRPFRR